jgi:TRAP-type C4-dicarboxylate transport system permease small subunit
VHAWPLAVALMQLDSFETPPDRAAWQALAERLVGVALTVICGVIPALLVVADVILLFTGVVARYVFNDPLNWSDELAAALFLWLGMLGAVAALRRREHMRLAAFLRKRSPGTRRWFDTAALVAMLIFLGAMVLPAAEYVQAQQIIMLPPSRNVPFAPS